MVAKLPSRAVGKIIGDIPTGNLVGAKEISWTALFIAQSISSLTEESYLVIIHTHDGS